MDFNNLRSDEFENLTFDLLQAAGLKRLVWRTPGADGGRDIEGIYTSVDFSNYYHQQKWYIECKRYNSSIDWPTIWSKISYAECQSANFLLIVTNSNPSPACETQISLWNSAGNRLLVRVWRGYELEHILLNYSHVAAKYGLLGDSSVAELSLQNLMFEAMKLAQTSYVSYALGGSALAVLEANAALAEMVSAKHSQIKSYGRSITTATNITPPNYDWLIWEGLPIGWDEVGLRALLTMIKYITASRLIMATANKNKLILALESPRFQITEAAEKTLAEIAIWANAEIEMVEISSVRLCARV